MTRGICSLNCFNSLAALPSLSEKYRLVRGGVELIINQHLSNCGFSGEGWKAALQTYTLQDDSSWMQRQGDEKVLY